MLQAKHNALVKASEILENSVLKVGTAVHNPILLKSVSALRSSHPKSPFAHFVELTSIGNMQQ